MATTTSSPEVELAAKLERYDALRAVFIQHGMRLTSEFISRAKVADLLRTLPVGLHAIEGLPKGAFTPEDWEIV